MVGESGSGKTSLIMLIGGLERPTSGKIYFQDQEITKLSEDEVSKIRKKNMTSTLQSNHRRSSSSIFSNFFGLLKINRTYRKTRTNLLILHEKGVINLYYILSFILLVILATLTFVFVWQIILFPRMEENSGFEHYPKNLVPKEILYSSPA